MSTDVTRSEIEGEGGVGSANTISISVDSFLSESTSGFLSESTSEFSSISKSLGNITIGSLMLSTERFRSEYTEDETVSSIDSIKHMIRNFGKSPPTLEEALRIMEYENSVDLARMFIERGNEKLRNFKASGLTAEDIGVILCYTFEWDKKRFSASESPYRKLNSSLSVNRSSTALRKTRSFLYLMLRVLRKLPRFIPEDHILYRGIKVCVQTETDPEFPDRLPYAPGNVKTWWAFTSTTESLGVVRKFIKRSEGTIFTLSGEVWGYNISIFSDFPEEKEILLEPERRLRVESMSMDKGTVLVNAKMLISPLVLLEVVKVKPIKISEINYVKEIPKGFTLGNVTGNSVELSWAPVVVEKRNVSYRVAIKKYGPSLRRKAEIVYEGAETKCTVTDLSQSTEYEFKLCCGYGGYWGQWNEGLSTKTELVGWREFSEDVDKKYQVSEKNPRVATNIGEYVYSSIIGNTTLPVNKVSLWNIKILKSRDNNCYGINIGVAPPDINQDGDYNYGKCGWYLHCYNSTLYSGPPHNYDGKVYGPKKREGGYVNSGDKVCVIMDTRNGNLSYIVGGMNYGVAYEGIPLDNPLAPCVLLLYKHDSVELLFNN